MRLKMLTLKRFAIIYLIPIQFNFTICQVIPSLRGLDLYLPVQVHLLSIVRMFLFYIKTYFVQINDLAKKNKSLLQKHK